MILYLFVLAVLRHVLASELCDANGKEKANVVESIASFDLTQILGAIEMKCNNTAPTTSCAPIIRNYTTSLTFVTATQHKYYEVHFNLHSRYCLAGHNIAVFEDVSLSDCAYECVRNNACVGFNYFNSRRCELKYSVSLLTFRLSAIPAHDCDFLYKDCAKAATYTTHYREQTYYQFTTHSGQFAESVQACRKIGMTLMEVGDQTEFAAILSFMQKQQTNSWFNAVYEVNGSSTGRVWEVSRASVPLSFYSDKTEANHFVKGYPVSVYYCFNNSPYYCVKVVPPTTRYMTVCQCNEYNKIS